MGGVASAPLSAPTGHALGTRYAGMIVGAAFSAPLVTRLRGHDGMGRYDGDVYVNSGATLCAPAYHTQACSISRRDYKTVARGKANEPQPQCPNMMHVPSPVPYPEGITSP